MRSGYWSLGHDPERDAAVRKKRLVRVATDWRVDFTYHGTDRNQAVLRVHKDDQEQGNRRDLLRHGEGVDDVQPQVGLANVRCSASGGRPGGWSR